MNERIRELEKQAWEFVDKNWNWANANNPSQATLFKTKFAELIVKECARAVDKVYEDAEPDHGCYDWATWAEGADVLKHFGVEDV
jgi:hypothetical protein